MTRKNDGRCDFCDAEIPIDSKVCPNCGREQLEAVMDKRDWADWDSESEDHKAEEASQKIKLKEIEIAEPAVIVGRLRGYFIGILPVFIFVNLLILLIGFLLTFVLSLDLGSWYRPIIFLSSDLLRSFGTILLCGGGIMMGLCGWGATLSPPPASINPTWSKTSMATQSNIQRNFQARQGLLSGFQARQGHLIIMGIYSFSIFSIGMVLQF